MIKYLEWDTNFFGVKCGKCVLDHPVTDEEWAQFMREQKDYDFVSIINMGTDRQNAVRIGRDTPAFEIDTNVRFIKKLKSLTPMPEGVTVTEALPRDDFLISISSFEHSKFYADEKLRARGGAKVYENWLLNAFGKKGNYFVVAEGLGYCLFTFEDGKCVMELMRVAENSRGTGVGKKLVDAVEHTAYSKGYDTIVLGTQLTNLGAINFYIHRGKYIERSDTTYHLWNI